MRGLKCHIFVSSALRTHRLCTIYFREFYYINKHFWYLHYSKCHNENLHFAILGNIWAIFGTYVKTWVVSIITVNSAQAKPIIMQNRPKIAHTYLHFFLIDYSKLHNKYILQLGAIYGLFLALSMSKNEVFLKLQSIWSIKTHFSAKSYLKLPKLLALLVVWQVFRFP